MIFATALALQVAAGREVSFTFRSPGAKSVAVAGSFNGWNKDANPMRLGADGRTWATTVRLPYGRHEYKFVRDGSTWLPDPNAPKADDGNGNTNSVLLVLPADYDRPAKIGDGVVATSTILHDRVPKFVNYDRGQLSIKLRARPNDAKRVLLLVGGRPPVEMKPSGADEVVASYVAAVPWDRKSDLRYSFRLEDGKAVTYDAAGARPFGAGPERPFLLKAAEFRPFVVPSWPERSVMYQIFPDRFEDGSEANDPKGVLPWNAEPTYFNRFGGDAAGVSKRLGYLRDLGVSTVYFNPIFSSPSNHRYDATDYKRVDPEIGTNDEFVALVAKMKAAGIRTTLDFAFNHTATDNAFFKDLVANGPASKYRDWYFPKSYPIVVKENPPYEAWFGFPSMPKLNVMNPPTGDYLMSVVRYWMVERGVDGARLDVANEVDPRFWRRMRMELKAVKPEAYILGEMWGDASAWLGGDQWDATMNYRFREAVLGFLAGRTLSPTALGDRLMAQYADYPPQVDRALMNLLGSHDTPRILTMVQRDGDLARLAATLQFGWVGMPSVYYGDELGMEGGADPQNRRGMRWDLATSSNPFLAHYRKLTAARNSSRALQSGDPRVLLADDAAGTFGFARLLPAFGGEAADAALVAINRSDTERTVSLPVPPEAKASRWSDALSGRAFVVEGGRVLILLPPKGAAILLPRSSGPSSSPRTAQ